VDIYVAKEWAIRNELNEIRIPCKSGIPNSMYPTPGLPISLESKGTSISMRNSKAYSRKRK
jgi:hypothetical protein